METKRKSAVLPLAMTAVMTAVTCVLAPMSIPIGPVPFSLTNFVIYISLYVLGWKWGTVSYAAYLLLGMVGMPVFSGFSAGLGRLVGHCRPGDRPHQKAASALPGYGGGHRCLLRLRHRLVLLSGQFGGGSRPGAVRMALHPGGPD